MGRSTIKVDTLRGLGSATRRADLDRLRDSTLPSIDDKTTAPGPGGGLFRLDAGVESLHAQCYRIKKQPWPASRAGCSWRAERNRPRR